MRFYEFQHLTYNYEELIYYLCENNVIKKTVECPRCKTVLNIVCVIIIICVTNILMFHFETGNYYKIVSGQKKTKKDI